MGKRIVFLLALLQLSGLVALCWTDWFVAIVGLALIIAMNVVRNLGFKVLLNTVWVLIGAWGWLSFPYFRPMGISLAVLITLSAILGVILCIAKGGYVD